MIQKMFSIFDSKACFYGPIWFESREESAVRAFSDSVNNSDPKNGFFTHPEDYHLYFLGTFDNETAEIDKFPPRSLVTASSVKRDSSQMELFDMNGANKPAII